MTTPENLDTIVARVDAIRDELAQLVFEYREALACLTPPEADRPICEYATVAIPGTVYVDVAENEDGTWSIVHNTNRMMRFTPLAGAAGGFHDAAEFYSATDCDDEGMVEGELNVANVDGPFWQAVRRFNEATDAVIYWDE